MQLFQLLPALALARSVASLTEAELVVAKVEASLVATSRGLIESSLALKQAACADSALDDPVTRELLARTRALDSEVEAQVRAVAALAPTAAHLQKQIDEQGETQTRAVSHREQRVGDLEEGLEQAQATIQTVDQVLSILEGPAASGGGGAVVGVFKQLKMDAENTVQKLEQDRGTQTSDFGDLMAGARQAQRQLQESYTLAHERAVNATVALNLAKAERSTVSDMWLQDVKVQDLHRTACAAALGPGFQSGALWKDTPLPGAGFQRRVENLEVQAQTTEKVLAEEVTHAAKNPQPVQTTTSTTTAKPAKLLLAAKPPRVEAAADVVRAAAQKEGSSQLARLADALETHSAEEDLHMLAALDHRRSANLTACENARFAAAVAQQTARDKAMGVTEQHALAALTVGMNDRVLAALALASSEDRQQRLETAWLGLVQQVVLWTNASDAAASHADELAGVVDFMDQYAAGGTATPAGQALPKLLKVMQENVAWLRDETAAREAIIDKAAKEWSFEASLAQQRRMWYREAVESLRSGNATQVAELEAQVTAAKAELETARDATDAATACHAQALHSVETRVVRVAEAALQPPPPTTTSATAKRALLSPLH